MRAIQGVFVCVLMLCSSAALALGLGNIRVLSRPGEPLLAEIPVIASDPGELEAARVGLASAETFERVGLSRPEGLVSALQFQFAQDAQGRAVVRVTSAAPVQAPALSFLIEVDWGQGRLVREYSALIATPDTATAVAEPLVEAPQAAPSDMIVREAPPAPAPAGAAPVPVKEPAQAVATPAAPRPGDARPASAGGDVLAPVQRGQALSQIALGLARERGATLDQTMVALLRANPEAFIRGNVNLLREGAVLRVPDSDALQDTDAAAARAIVREHVAQWRQARAAVPQPAIAGNVEKAAGTAPATAGGARLEIATAVPDGQRTAGTTTGLDAGGEGDMAANDQLRQAREDLATRDAELQELRERVADLEKLQQQQQSLIAMKDSDLAAAQQRLAEAGKQPSAGAPWMWLGLALLVLAAVGGWWLSRRRRPSPLPPLPRMGEPRAEGRLSPLAAAMPGLQAGEAEAPPDVDGKDAEEAAAVAAHGLPADEASSEEDGLEAGVEPAPFWPASDADAGRPRPPEPVLLFAASRTPGGDDGAVPMKASAGPAQARWPDDGAAGLAPLNPAPAGRERLELAIAYLDLGDAETARTLLNEVATGRDPQARAEALELLGRLG
ncbi:hypothetical protein K5L01_05635 [Stenotrophomonas sp. CPCC 101365]|uniref:FimV N-terminal domain-containing protein n=2 Tax=Stenotrophomonas mori TaxID=2871096 RepID=A0ABT0SGD2_9GAMM|nr:FimV/HubP family polar landmark protein [Stenotrophomonas mori]MCL7714133.1 hypothetical protein [Stenotrophomonas mori]